ncbi:bacteriorhodopsin [Alteriqipengyuania lutimaris]|uniref:Rhodopsin n=1 Tax=Alteriqipengyuania lutimaris TaxID=1538146 RepID=A0A395LIT7_9SPHN|nr:bacteriorhodopsin [Alteriqipengyuania lutimaris]MBB3034507.1 bacteriorhodopsin [Alteriqipengyuania lutimaris]RDS76605.1 hypothetical protein DL238_02620 [Alteriqipengyuania lutimaris]
MSAIQLPLLIGFAIMAIGSIAIFLHGPKGREFRHDTQFHSVVPFIAATAYLAMFLGTGVVEIGATQTFFPRYADWAVTTPILLAGLILTGLHEHPRHSTFILPAIILDVIMIATGLLAALSEGDARWIWFAWSCAAFFGVLFILWGPVKAIGDNLGGGIERVYRRNLVFLTAVWLVYPVVFAFGPEGLQSISTVASVWIVLALDVVAKVVYGFVATARFNTLPGAHANEAGSAG